ncbi:diaminohydroxyphosphoribosylaminopyrimidine deaminase [Candidatus Kinetoplastibacterium desouzaii TCC079E]|uniref:Riboflavin biosynthesis protein RibD n=2 Tax=Candidatus Kinetoplastidibacterium desouzai TaxID=994692 RepID=M1LV51_9PROT|nr:diaminohydroxyphosphoribosylaminopyrimidine deaminase [Candidatus Kinetoplastibacterium desouzaii TCC079E]
MGQALDLARDSVCCAPNPSVGCIIVKDTYCIGRGSTESYGGNHAEVVAIKDALSKGYVLAGSTIYVTLEPCCHYGKTPPCLKSILDIQPLRVVIAVLDPNPIVSGKSVNQLRLSGIIVDVGVCRDEALWLNIGFFSRMLISRSWVRTKIASSLDGKSSLYNKQSKWITCNNSRKDGHYWRARSGAILTGIGTVIHDNPSLTVRYFPTSKQPIKAIVDDNFVIDPNSNIFDGSRVVIFTAISNKEKENIISDKNGEVVLIDSLNRPDNLMDLNIVMSWFHQNNINEIHVEAGPGLNGRLLITHAIDEFLIYVAPILIGDANSIVKLPIIDNLKESFSFSILESLIIDKDIRLRLYTDSSWDKIKASFI